MLLSLSNSSLMMYSSLEWDDTKKQFKADLEEILGRKSRSLGCYSLIATAVKYIYDQNQAVFESLGRTWQEMMTEFLPGRFKDAIRTTYPEISRPDLAVKNYLRDISRILAGLSISEASIHINKTQLNHQLC